ncbi:hypothetical protein C0991_005193 [Blastosporella zonata]|nr:hypothetical protein C0991_005193 [Blastosporella zonata]
MAQKSFSCMCQLQAQAKAMRATTAAERAKLACTNCRRDNKKCDDQRPCSRPCASCVRKGMECIERACKDCSREGRAAECTHRKAQAAAMAEASDEAQGSRPDGHRTSYSEKDYTSQSPQQRLHLPPISHPPPYAAPPHAMYAPAGHMTHLGPAGHYYYSQQGMIGPGQPPQPVMQPYGQRIQSEQRVAYYPAIDPNIDNESTAGASRMYSSTSTHEQDHNAGPSASTSASR